MTVNIQQVDKSKLTKGPPSLLEPVPYPTLSIFLKESENAEKKLAWLLIYACTMATVFGTVLSVGVAHPLNAPLGEYGPQA